MHYRWVFFVFCVGDRGWQGEVSNVVWFALSSWLILAGLKFATWTLESRVGSGEAKAKAEKGWWWMCCFAWDFFDEAVFFWCIHNTFRMINTCISPRNFTRFSHEILGLKELSYFLVSHEFAFQNNLHAQQNQIDSRASVSNMMSAFAELWRRRWTHPDQMHAIWWEKKQFIYTVYIYKGHKPFLVFVKIEMTLNQDSHVHVV